MEIRTIQIPEISKKAFKVTTSNRNVLRMHVRTQEIAEKLVGYMYGLTDEQLENAAGETGPKD